MASCVLRIVLRSISTLSLLAFALAGPLPAANAASAPSLGLMAGDRAGSEIMLAQEAADLFAGGEVAVKPGDAGRKNIAALIQHPGAGLAFVSADALAAVQGDDADGTLTGQLELVLLLGPQEIHVVAGPGIETMADLAGKPVNFGPAGTSTAVTAERLFETLRIAVEPLALHAKGALAKLKDGSLAASVFVGAKPTPLIGDIPPGLGLHLVPIEFGPDSGAAFLPARLEHDDYPNLIAGPSPVPTLATGLLLLTAKPEDDRASERLARFVETLFSRIAELQAAGKHPKWRDINLAAGLPGLTRTMAADVWLAERAARAKPVAASAAGASFPSLTSEDQQEALFKRFIEWRRAKGH